MDSFFLPRKKYYLYNREQCMEVLYMIINQISLQEAMPFIITFMVLVKGADLAIKFDDYMANRKLNNKK